MPDVKRTQHQNETTDQAISPMRPVLSAYRMARRLGCGEAGGGGGLLRAPQLILRGKEGRGATIHPCPNSTFSALLRAGARHQIEVR